MTTPTPETGTPDPATPPADPPSPDPEGTPETGDLQAQLAAALADAEKWKNHSRTNEDKAKANKAELDRIRREGMTPDEKALDEAREQARAEVLQSVAADRAADAIRLELGGRNVDVDALLEGVDLGKFTADGKPDRDAIANWADRIAPKPDPNAEPAPPVPDTGGGAGGFDRDPARQLTRADLASMSPAQIDKARRDGRFADLLGGKTP